MVNFLFLNILIKHKEQVKKKMSQTIGKLSAYGMVKKLTPEDIIRIRGNKGMRLTASPFVSNATEVAFIGKAASWKGVKSPKGTNLANLRAANPKVADALENAQKIGDACKDLKGVVFMGDRYLSVRNVCMINRGKNGKKAA
jgi:hypothetical protein